MNEAPTDAETTRAIEYARRSGAVDAGMGVSNRVIIAYHAGAQDERAHIEARYGDYEPWTCDGCGEEFEDERWQAWFGRNGERLTVCIDCLGGICADLWALEVAARAEARAVPAVRRALAVLDREEGVTREAAVAAIDKAAETPCAECGNEKDVHPLPWLASLSGPPTITFVEEYGGRWHHFRAVAETGDG